MSEIGEDFKFLKEVNQKKRASHREQSPKMLEDAGIQFEVKNLGAHLIVEGNECFIDFWPGTGKWISRNGAKGFGVRNLITHILS